MIIPIILLTVSLSIDALGVGVAYGLRKIKIPLIPKLVICAFSIIYSFLAITVGKSLAVFLPPFFAKLIGIGILAVMGLWIIIQALLSPENYTDSDDITWNQEKTLVNIVLKSLGITVRIIKNPVLIDMDKSGIIDIKESLLLGLALSVDAIGVGIGSALTGFHSAMIPFAVGLFQLVFLYIGNYLGEKFTVYQNLNKRLISILPGIMLLFLALLRLT